MSLPDNYSPYESIQDALKRIHNTLVREYFRDDIDESSLATPESALKTLCIMTDNDNGLIIILRTIIFFFYVGYFYYELANHFYGLPKTTFNDSVSWYPQLVLSFQEPYLRKLGSRNKFPKRVLVKYRLFINPDTVTRGTITSLRSIVNIQFPESWEHFCGHDCYFYNDRKNKIQLTIFSNNRSEAIDYFKNILNILDAIPNSLGLRYDFKDKYVKKLENSNELETETITIAGDTVKQYRNQVTGYVKLKKATLEIQNWYGDNVIIDRGRL